jgi:glycosyltransferase involved in cell wall biosynthesis
LNYVATVYNGLDFTKFVPPKKPGNNLVWIGRFCNEKGAKEAIQVAKKTGMNLIMAGKIDALKKDNYEYYEYEIAPHIDNRQIKYIGEVDNKQKIALLRKAKALLNPVNWNEPFGLTTIEAMAMGVPVIAFDRGPMRETIMDGKTGFVVKNVKEMAQAVKRIDELNRPLIGQYARSHFSADAMTENYLKVYEAVMKKAYRNHKIQVGNIVLQYGLEKTNN